MPKVKHNTLTVRAAIKRNPRVANQTNSPVSGVITPAKLLGLDKKGIAE